MKLEKRENIILYIISIGVTLISYFAFLKEGYFSIDTAKIVSLGYDGYAYYYSLYDGRLLMAVIGIISNVIQIGIKHHYIILLILSIIISSFSVMKIYSVVMQIKPTDNKIIKLLIFIASYCYIYHFMNINNFEFAECIIMSISILCFILSAEKIILEDKKIIATLLCILGVFCYQGTINMFIATSTLFILMQKNKINKTYIIKKVGYLIAVLAISGGISYIATKIIQSNIQSIQIDRINFNIVSNVIENIKFLPELIFESIGLYPKFLHAIFIIIFLTLSYVYGIKHNKISEFWVGLLLIISFYVSCLILGAIYPEFIWTYNGRVFGAIGASISAYILFIYANSKMCETKIFKQILISISILYFITIIINTCYMTIQFKNANKIDEEFTMQIVSQIEKYEQENNKKITKMAINYITDNSSKLSRTEKRSQKFLTLYNSSQIKIYSNRDIEKIMFEDEIKNQYFKESEEKMICIEDTIYIQTKL